MNISKINFTGMTKPVRRILENRMYEKEDNSSNSYYKNINDPKLGNFDSNRPVRTREDYLSDLDTIERSKHIDIGFDNTRGFLVYEKYKFRSSEDFPVELEDNDFQTGLGNFYTIPNIAKFSIEIEDLYRDKSE